MRALKKIFKIVLILLLAVILVVGGYFAYVFIAYHRIGDQTLTPTETDAAPINVGQTYTILSYNIGFGAYEADYGFFMDGGKESRAWSEERLKANLTKIRSFVESRNADLAIIQEVDIGSTRSYKLDERTYFAFDGKASVFAQNFDSPYLFYPVLCPHGIARSGILTLSSFPIASSQRVELPVETGVMKILDLDRCYTKSRIPASDGKELVQIGRAHV